VENEKPNIEQDTLSIEEYNKNLSRLKAAIKEAEEIHIIITEYLKACDAIENAIYKFDKILTLIEKND